jgi:hypothetical protein
VRVVIFVTFTFTAAFGAYLRKDHLSAILGNLMWDLGVG